MTERRSIAWLVVAGLALVGAGGCSFDTAVLDERRCTSNDECTNGQTCTDGICQSLAAEQDAEEDIDVGDDVEDPCQDFDGDIVLGGVGCNASPLDCNDFDSQVHPGAEEVCDGKDNDCDELTDTEDDNYLEQDCALTEGVCLDTHKTCTDGLLEECTAEVYGSTFAASEDGDLALCDGLDNDCDGTADENIRRDCYTGLPAETEDVGLCHGGTQACTGDDVFGPCEGEVVPVSEDLFETRCDTLDNDCNGDDDEECRCLPGEQRICFGIPGFDEDNLPNPPCRLGREVCQDNNRFGDCTDEVLPADGETCSDPGIDNDCDGSIDPNQISQVPVGGGSVQDWGTACSTGLDGICSTGTFLCVQSGLECVPNNEPVPETCDNPGSDDDCDGLQDNIPADGDPCRVTSFDGNDIDGTCQFGNLDCEGSSQVCRPSNSRTEVCDAFDDDCDGNVDDGFNFPTNETHCGFCGNACGGTDETCCGGDCTNSVGAAATEEADMANCGACGNDCLTDHPELGTQAIAERSALVTECCQNACTDLALDEDNCGTCGATCSGTSDTCCDGGCVDSDTDEEHCGGCNIACDTATEQCCGGSCIALDDSANCGDCDTPAVDRTCTASQGCCSVPLAESDGRGTAAIHYACRPLNADPLAGVGAARGCGACGVDCDSFDTAAAPATNFTCRNTPIGTCFDELSNADHCGSAGTDCPGTTPACCNVTGAGTCRDLSNDNNNCGGCGITCSGPQQCCGGVCVADDDPAHCGTCTTVCTASQICCTNPTAGNPFICLNPQLGVAGPAGTTRTHCGFCDTNLAVDATNDSTCAGLDDSCIEGFCTDTSCNVEHCGTGDAECNVRGGFRCCATNIGATCQSGATMCGDDGDPDCTFACVALQNPTQAACCGDGVCEGVTGETTTNCAADCVTP